MKQISPVTASEYKYRPGLPLRLSIIGALFFAEKIFLNRFVDFERADAAKGLGAFVRFSQHWGFRFLIALAAAIAVFAFVSEGQMLSLAKSAIRMAPIRTRWIAAHTVLIASLVPLTSLLFGGATGSLSFAVGVSLWVALAIGAAISATLAMASWPLWSKAAQALGTIWWYAAAAALLGASAMQLSQHLWAPTAAITFDLVRLVLSPVMPALQADASTRVLSSHRFAVEVSEVCSGLEGMGLILAFTVAWLLYFRREYRFPHALLLVPLGILVIFALNILRIAVLMLIGDAGYPDVAVFGFHSQAGWIAFNVVACALVFFSRRSAWLNHSTAISSLQETTENPTAAYLMPFLAILMAGILSRAVSGSFENFYALRLIAGISLLAVYWRRLLSIDWRWSWRGPSVGVLVFLVWVIAARFLVPESSMPQELTVFQSPLRGFWIAARVATSVLVVPVVEELAYRGYLMRRLTRADFESVAYQSIHWRAVAVTAVVFGLAHGAMWLPGIVAGLALGIIVVRRGTIGEGLAAHTTANGLIALTVLIGNQWQLW